MDTMQHPRTRRSVNSANTSGDGRAMVKTHKEFEDKIGKDLLSAIYKETGYTPN